MADGTSVREWEIAAYDKEIEIAPGVFFPAWTYNGQVPGPTLRANEGDRLRVHFTNAGTHPHTMHFHGIHAPLWTGSPASAAARSERGEVHLRVRRQTLRLPPLPLPLDAVETAHPQGALRRLHRQSRSGQARGCGEDAAPGPCRVGGVARVRHGHERLRHHLRRGNEVYAVNSVAFHYMKHPIEIDQPGRSASTWSMSPSSI